MIQKVEKGVGKCDGLMEVKESEKEEKEIKGSTGNL